MGVYLCTKTVEAWEILKVTAVERSPFPRNLAFHLADGSIRVKPAEITSRYQPKPGDYLVEYEDGYCSISPKAVFEAGYVKKES